MSKGPGKLQVMALKIATDKTALVTPYYLAYRVFGESPTDSNVRSARRALQSLATAGKITDHGFTGGYAEKIYGAPQAKAAHGAAAYVQAMREFYESLASRAK